MLVALLGSLVTEVATLVERGRFDAGNFFSYFTVEANLFVVVVLLATALAGPARGPGLELLRGAATLYMVTTFVVFSLLLADLDPSLLTAVPWDNTVLHYLVPVLVTVDWVLDPPRARIPFRRAALWLVVPLVYVVYSLVRGAVVDWYPYPFLDPANGTLRLVVVCVGIAAVVTAFTWLITRVRPRH